MTSAYSGLAEALSDRYRIERELGQGGMATVYLAEDLRHDRSVAIKVLKPELAAVIGADRFLTEIKTTANLQHPHILPLFSSGQADSFLYFVMPYVEGESLREKLDREKQLPVDEAVRIATEIAQALDYAHARGVIHRDIKPANILLHEGRVLVADFGIALAVQQAGGTRLTETGLSVGTPQYMSPEQATGDRELDGRSDIYSLGCMLYEMLAGEPPHTGPTAQAIFAKVLTEEPRPLVELRPKVAGHVADVVDKAIERLPADRFATARELVLAIGDPTRVGSGASQPSAARVGILRAPSWPSPAWFLVGAAVGSAAAWMALQSDDPATPLPVRELLVELPTATPMPLKGTAWQDLRSLDLAPDGSFIVHEGRDADGIRLYRRFLDRAASEPIGGTEGAFYPFISPDGRWVAFFADGQLKKASLFGGGTVTLGTPEVPPFGATWISDEEILVSELGELVRYSAQTAGSREALSSQCGGQQRCWHPQLLPGREHLLVSGYLTVAALSLESGEWVPLVEGVRVPTARFMEPGYLVYFEEPGRLFARRLDVESLEVGPPIPVMDGVRQNADGEFAFSAGGDLAFVPGGDRHQGRLTWRWRDGREELLPFPEQAFGVFRLSPDGRYLAASVRRRIAEVWLYDLTRQESRRLSDDRYSEHPVWSPDGSELVWGVVEPDMVSQSIVSWSMETGEIRTIAEDAGLPYSWGPDDVLGVVLTNQVDSSNDIVFMQRESGEMETFLASPDVDDTPMFAPDGSAVAYFSALEGEWEVYVTPYPPEGRPTKISRGRSFFPLWSPDGRRVYYQSGENERRFYSVDLSAGLDAPGAPRLLFEGPYMRGPGHSFDVASDDERFLVVKLADERLDISSITWIQNFRSRLEAALAAAGS